MAIATGANGIPAVSSTADEVRSRISTVVDRAEAENPVLTAPPRARKVTKPKAAKARSAACGSDERSEDESSGSGDDSGTEEQQVPDEEQSSDEEHGPED
jgi:hypothetical protein